MPPQRAGSGESPVGGGARTRSGAPWHMAARPQVGASGARYRAAESLVACAHAVGNKGGTAGLYPSL